MSSAAQVREKQVSILRDIYINDRQEAQWWRTPG